MTDLPPMWKDMTPEEKGALLLAHHEGKTIEYFVGGRWLFLSMPSWGENCRYRVKPEPVRETVTLYGRKQKVYGWLWNFRPDTPDTHILTYETKDGEPVNGTFDVRRIGDD